MNYCECTDPGCPVEHGAECSRIATGICHRSDMEDLTGVAFCDDCMADAIDSGVFGEPDADHMDDMAMYEEAETFYPEPPEEPTQ